MNDSELTGDALLKRIDELTCDSVRDPSGGNGWRHLLFAAGQQIRSIVASVVEIDREVVALHRELRDSRRELREYD